MDLDPITRRQPCTTGDKTRGFIPRGRFESKDHDGPSVNSDLRSLRERARPSPNVSTLPSLWPVGLTTRTRPRACIHEDSVIEPSPSLVSSATAATLPLFSVIIPVRDGADTIVRATSSVLNQTYPHVEAVVVVNASTDRTVDTLAAINDPRLRVIQLSQAGRSHARNVGIHAAHGEFLIFLDADDELLPAKVETAWRLLSRGFDAVQGGALYVPEVGESAIVLPHMGHNFIGRLHIRNTIAINSMAIRRRDCAEFPEDTEYCEDWEFWLRTLPGLRIATYHTPDCVVHTLANSTSSDVERMKSNEIPIYTMYQPPAMPLWWRFKRVCLLTLALTIYAGVEPIPRVEWALADSRSAASTVRALRRLRRSRTIARHLIRAVFKI